MTLAAPTPPGGVPPVRPIRVLVAEDSTTVRRLLVELLASDPGFEVVGEATTGAEAIALALDLQPDLITMDVHMPVLDGLDATKEIMREVPTPILIVSSAANRGDVGLALSATQAGALMVVPKPESPRDPDFERQRAQFLGMARAMAAVKVVRRWSPGAGVELAARAAAAGRRARRPGGIRVVAVGTSTGGPAALRRLLIDVPRDFPVPILVVQHMARGFIDGLATWLGTNLRLRVTVAADGEPLVGGTVYLAPDDRHLGIAPPGSGQHVGRGAGAAGAGAAGAGAADAGAVGGAGRAALLDTAAVGGFRPSADVLFDSCARAHGAGVAALVLTGMGRDGVDGLARVHAAGGRVLAQDEASSVVYGMAQEAVRAGVVHEVLPLDTLGRRVVELVDSLA